MRWIALIVVAAWATFVGIGPTAAQEASPEALPAVECTVEPYSLEELQAIVGTSTAATQEAETVPAASPPAAELPAGEAADEATTEAVTGTIQEVVACINAGDVLRVLPLYSDDFARTLFAGEGVTQEVYDQFAEADPAEPGEEVLILAFSEVVLLDDGRAAVLVTGDDLGEEDPASDTLFYLVEEGGRWRVDSFVESDDV